MKSYYILIRGPLGIGKTTISKELAEVLKAKIFHIDKILEEFKLDKVDGKCGYIPLKNFLKANESILSKIKEILDKGKVVIIDGCFYHKEQLEDINKSLREYERYVFTLKASLKTCMERNSKRKNIYGKEAVEAVYNLVNKFDYDINIDTEGKSMGQVIKEILEKLR